MFNLRLRQAEAACKEGRLDEAVELARQRDVREHHDGQKLITRLTAALVARGHEHLAAGRIDEARRDCRQAESFGGNQTDVAEFAAAIAETTDAQRRQSERDRELVTAVSREVDRGECAVGERILERVSDDISAAGRLGDRIAVRREQIDAALERVKQAVESNRKFETMSALQELQRLNPQHPELPALIDRVTGPVVSEVRTAANEGRLDRAAVTLEAVRPLIDLDPELGELDRMLSLAQQVSDDIAASRFDEAAAGAKTLRTLLGKADWVKQLADRTEQAAALAAELKSTPLRLLEGLRLAETHSYRDSGTPAEPRLRKQQPARPEPRPLVNNVGPDVSGGYLLRIDGIGSALLLPGSRLRIGAAGRSQADLALSGYPQGEASTIERIGGDYRFRAGCEARLNGKPSKEKLLSADERIELGRRCRVRFRKPHAASSSALIELTGTRLSRADVRTVVLFDDTVIAGPSRSCHLVGASLEQPLVVFRRGGEFFVRNGIAGRGPRAAEAMPLEIGQPVETGGVRVTLSAVDTV